ncbi:MAG: nucleoside kinase [Negativicutes bacterium]
MQEKITLEFSNGRTLPVERGTALLEVSRQLAKDYSTPIVAVRVENDIKDLSTVLEKNCSIDFLDLTTDAGSKVYQRSLSFVLIAAVRELFPDGEVIVEHSISKGLYCEVNKSAPLSAEEVLAIEKRMRLIVEQDRPIERKVVPTATAIQLFEASGNEEKVRLLRQMKRQKVSIYYCGELYDYFYGTMVPSTGYLTTFGLHFYAPGLVLMFPEKEQPGVLPEFVERPKLAKVFREAERWGKILECPYVATLNDKIKSGDFSDIIRVAEALHEKKVAQLADFITQHASDVRLVMIAGPSSSGKTTFAQRLNVQLRVNALRPVPISLDDYFVDRRYTPRDEFGKPDFESIEAIDLSLFNDHLTRLLNGEKVQIPSYNFVTGQQEYNGKSIQVDKTQPLLIEGIHGLNERLTSAVPRDNKIKIYISPLTQLSIDPHNRISTTDARLIRRIVRDSQFRSHDALKTLQIWPSVRRGEERNIFPFQEEVDVMFNSALIYELGVLKKYAEPLLEKVGVTHPEYVEAKRLLDFLEYFHSIDDMDVPPNSILKEFIGMSCFYR